MDWKETKAGRYALDGLAARACLYLEICNGPSDCRTCPIKDSKKYTRLLEERLCKALADAESATVVRWVSPWERMPDAFVSVLGVLEDEEPFPRVRECYWAPEREGWYFPALGEFRDVCDWAEMPTAPKDERGGNPCLR